MISIWYEPTFSYFLGNLVASMAVKKYTLPINTLEDLAQNPNFQAGLVKGVALYDLFSVRT